MGRGFKLNHPLDALLENVDRPYYFGLGGIGDFLLLMATFYDHIEPNEVDVVFLCNNMKPMQDLVNPKPLPGRPEPLFPSVNRFWLFPRKAAPIYPELWDRLVEDPRLAGTGVTPRRFDYVSDWNRCGKSTVFDYYGVERNPGWATMVISSLHIPLAVIQPFGGADDPTKIKRISSGELKGLVDGELSRHRVVFIGSKSDLDKIRQTGFDTRANKGYTIQYVSDIREAIGYIRVADRFIGADSWGKTYAALAGVETIEVYRNKYIQRTPQQMFGQDTDPGDYVFLHNWGFTMKDDSEVV